MQKHMGIFIEEEVGFRLCDFARKREVSLSEAIGELLDIGSELSEESVNRLREFSEDYAVSLSEAIDELLENWNDGSPTEQAKPEDGHGGSVLPQFVLPTQFFKASGGLKENSKSIVAEKLRQEFPDIGGITKDNSSLANVSYGKQWFSGCYVSEAADNGRYFLLYDQRDEILHVLHADAKFFADNREKLTIKQPYLTKKGGFVGKRFLVNFSTESHNKFWDKYGKKVNFSGCKNWKIKVTAE